MNSVAQRSLGDLLTLKRRPVNVVPETPYAEIGIYSFGRGIFHKSPRSGLEVGDKPLFLIQEDDFILHVTFAWEGAVGLATSAEDGMYGSVRFPTFRVNEALCYPPYLLHYFRSIAGREQLVRICPGSAGRNRVLSLKRMPEVLVPLPDLGEQRRIAARIERLAAKIEKAKGLRRKAIEEAEALFPSQLSAVMRDARQAWGVASIREVTISASGFGFPRGFQGRIGLPYPFVKVSDMNLPGNERYISSAQNSVDDELLGAMGARAYPKGTVIFPKIGGAIATNKRRILTARGTFDNNVMGLVPSSKLTSEWLYYFMLSVDLAQLQSGTSVPAVKQSKVEQLDIPLPPLPEQRRIVARLDDLQPKVNSLKRLQAETAAQLDAMLPSILDKAFKGEL